MDKKQV